MAKPFSRIFRWLDRKGILKYMPDSLYIKIMFKLVCGYSLNLKNPKTFNEKIQWLKLRGNLHKYADLVDKYEVRKHITETIGGKYLIPLIGVWDNVEDIDFNKLPEQFVLKCNHDWDSVVICTDKATFNIESARRKLNSCLKRNFYYNCREPQYKNIKPKIICEKYMVDESGIDLKDYKIFCFNGEPKIIQVNYDRNAELKLNFYDINWNYIPISLGSHPTDSNMFMDKPSNLEEMTALAKILSQHYPFVRVDFYSIYDKVYFGELTFTPNAGYKEFKPTEFNIQIGSWLKLPNFRKTKKIKNKYDRMLKSKNIHFLHSDKFANSTINFINKHFPMEAHYFLIVKNVWYYKYTRQKFPKGENIAEFTFDLLDPKDFINKRLIFHSFYIDGAVNWLYSHQYLLKNAYWMVWGGDFYRAPVDEVNTFVRQNIYGIGSFCDNDLIKLKYGSGHVFFDTNMAIAPTNFDIGKLSILRSRQRKNMGTVIQVNHSADTSTLEMFDVLARFKKENICIRTILSYKTGSIKSDRDIQEIIDKGYEIFGDKFSYLDKIISPDTYAEYLVGNDILVLNINQQSGVGNALSSIILGKKVFIKSNITVMQYFMKNKIEVFDTNRIKDMDFHEFCEIPQETILNNVKNAELLISEEKLISDFSTVFNDACPSLEA